jgi:hypothetical protein
MRDGIDIVLINLGDKREVYQELGKDLAGIEPPLFGLP